MYTKYGLPSARFLSRNWYTGSSVGAFLRYVQTIWYRVFRRCGEPRFVVDVLCVSCLPDWSTAGSTPAKPTMELRRGKRRTSPISAMSCAAVVSPTPYMARTVSYLEAGMQAVSSLPAEQPVWSCLQEAAARL